MWGSEMESDDFDQNLLQQFSCMGTTDREVLISQLQKLAGNKLNEATASFYLDMNNWNLHGAVGSFFDFESPNKLPVMSFVNDVTIGEGESVPPSTDFVKTWQVANGGEEKWPPGCSLKFTAGDQFSDQTRVMVDTLLPGESTHISVPMKSPAGEGIFQGKWRMCTPTGSYFGDPIWIILTVDSGGTMAVTQQLSQFHDLGSPPKVGAVPSNPFRSPDTQTPLEDVDEEMNS